MTSRFSRRTTGWKTVRSPPEHDQLAQRVDLQLARLPQQLRPQHRVGDRGELEQRRQPATHLGAGHLGGGAGRDQPVLHAVHRQRHVDADPQPDLQPGALVVVDLRAGSPLVDPRPARRGGAQVGRPGPLAAPGPTAIGAPGGAWMASGTTASPWKAYSTAMSTWRSRSISRVRPRDVATGSAPPWKLLERGGHLGPLGHLGRQLGLDLALAGDVEHHAVDQQPPVLVVGRRRLVAEPDHAPVAGQQPVLGGEALPALLAGGQLRDRAVAVLRMQRLGPAVRILQPLRGRIAKDRLDLRADVAALRTRLVDVHDPRQPLDQQPVALLALAQGGDQPLGVHADHLVQRGRQEAWRGPATRAVTQRRHDPSRCAWVWTKPARWRDASGGP